MKTELRDRGEVRRQRIWRLALSVMVAVSLLAVAIALGAARSTLPVRFTDVATPAMAEDRTDSSGACWADYDGDGDEDLFVASASRRAGEAVRLWRNDGGGAFANVADAAAVASEALKRAVGCAFADLDGDGDLDLYVTAGNHRKKGGGRENKIFRNNGDGTFTDLTARARVGMPGVGSASSDWADYDMDGDKIGRAHV